MIGHALGALLGGIVMQKSGARFAFLMTAIWLAVACFIFFVLNQFFSYLPTSEIVDETKLANVLEIEESDDDVNLTSESTEEKVSLDEKSEPEKTENVYNVINS